MVKKVRITKKNVYEEVFELGWINAALFAEVALDMGWTVHFFHKPYYVLIEKGVRRYFFIGAATPLNTFSSSFAADNKFITNTQLAAAGVPVSKSIRVHKRDLASGDLDLRGLRFPLVIKPNKGTAGGEGIRTDIRDKKTLKRMVKSALQKYEYVLIEEFHKGLNDYRILVFDGKVLGVTWRRPAYVVGDGRQSVLQLISERERMRKVHPGIVYKKIGIDAEMKYLLRQQRMTLQSVPASGCEVRLRNVCNIGTGGTVEDATNDISEANKRIATDAVQALGLRFAGVDLLCEDVSKSAKRTRGVVVEVNHQPGLSMHHFPHAGRPRNIARTVMRALLEK
ncbi:MAG: hypothetical protein ABIG66_00465 [Candidatus Kerfeldbacteria bacterium]